MTRKKQVRKTKKKKQTIAPAQSIPTQKRDWRPWLLALLAFLLYANTLGHDYCLDDFSVIKDNFVVKQGVKGIPTLLKTHYRYGYWTSKATLYRPLTLVMFAIEWQLAPDNPFPGHLLNVLFYALTIWLLYHFLTSLIGKTYAPLALVITALYAFHPVHTEVVANIKSRDEIMAFLLGLAGLHALIKYAGSQKTKYLLAALLTYTLALFAKESAVTWLAIYPLTIFWFRRTDWTRVRLPLLAFLAPTLIFLMIRKSIIGSVGDVASVSVLDNFFAQTHGGEYYGSALYMVGRYLWVLLFPARLVSDLGFNQIPVHHLGHPAVLAVIAVILGAAYWIYRMINKQNMLWRLSAYGLLFFAISFSIYSNLIVKIGSSYGERFLYMPSLGFAIVLGTLIYAIARKMKKPFDASNPVFWLWTAILAAYAVRTVTRNPAWYDSATLYATDIVQSPRSAKLNYHHGLETGKKGKNLSGEARNLQYKKAISFFQKAIEIYPKYSDAYGLMGLYYYRLGDKEKAMQAYEKAIQYNLNSPNVYSNMGIIYFERRDFANAERVYKLALKYNPRFVDAYRNLGAVYAMTGRFDQAIEQFKKGLQYDPDNITLLKYLASAYRDKGQPQRGAPYLQKAARLERRQAPK